MADKLIFDHTIEGFFMRGLTGQVSSRLKEKLRQAGLDLNRPLMSAYPIEVWMRCIGLTAQELYPTTAETEAWRLLGERMVEGYRKTVMGSAMFTLLKILGPRRTLERAQKNFRSGNNYTEVRFTDVSPTLVEVWMNETDLMRYFIQGVIQAGMRTSGAPNLRVSILQFDSQGTTYRVSWGER